MIEYLNDKSKKRTNKHEDDNDNEKVYNIVRGLHKDKRFVVCRAILFFSEHLHPHHGPHAAETPPISLVSHPPIILILHFRFILSNRRLNFHPHNFTA